MSLLWSDKLAAHYGLRLPPDLRAWIDGAWELGGGVEFSQPQTPEHLIEPNGTIWGGFMLPDTLPIIGNEYGDWLCLRIDPTGGVREVLYWCHGGGDWIPYGRTLSEALLYDAASRVLYARKPEFIEPEAPPEERYRLAEWALPFAAGNPAPLRPFWKQPPATEELLKQMATANIAEVVARRDLCALALSSRFRRESHPRLAGALGIPWEPDFVSWQFDAALVPPAQQARLEQHFQEPFATLTAQDWQTAEREALYICRKRQDLGWALEIAGWAAERRGDLQTAIGLYDAGLTAPVFSDDAVRFRTQWFPPGYGKFAAYRLGELRRHLPPAVSQNHYLQILLDNDEPLLRARVRDYWLKRAQTAADQHDFLGAYQLLYRAGWDIGLPGLEEYGPLLEQLATYAEQAGSQALATLARAHRRSLMA
ncbi:MAG TPA: SMI1/KNR4 family protein [Pirellulaceae bacterium]|nr:SMI1/KNR4 family protein [Pirellulaceae bacterium]